MDTKHPLVSHCAKTRKEMAHELNISVSTLYRRLQQLPFEVPGGLISPALQIQIYEALGYTWKTSSSYPAQDEHNNDRV